MIVSEAPITHQPSRALRAHPLNVLLVTDHLGHAGGVIHGASRYYVQVLPRLDRARFNTHLCILGGWHPFAETLEKAGVRPLFLNRSKWDPRALGDLLGLVRTLNIDVLHCLAMKGCLLGRIAGRITGTPSLIHLHDTNDPGRVIGFLQRRVAPWTHGAVAVSDLVREHAVAHFAMAPHRVETLYNGLDLDAFAATAPEAREQLRRELGVPADAIVIIVAGRVVESKGQRLLIELMPRLLERCPRAHLLIVGDGPDLGMCRQRAESLGLAGAVSLPGQRTDMPAILAAADIAAMPSLRAEGFGYVALEAAAAGKPVVAFDGGALSDIIDDQRTGFVVPRGDDNAFVEALLHLAVDPSRARRMGLAGAEHSRAFDIANHVDRLQDLYCAAARSSCPPFRGAPR